MSSDGNLNPIFVVAYHAKDNSLRLFGSIRTAEDAHKRQIQMIADCAKSLEELDEVYCVTVSVMDCDIFGMTVNRIHGVSYLQMSPAAAVDDMRPRIKKIVGAELRQRPIYNNEWLVKFLLDM